MLTLGTIAGGPVSEDPNVRAEIARRARESAETALALDANEGNAYQALGWILLHEWKWAEADAAFARALELSPNNVGALAARAVIVLGEGNYEEGSRLIERAASIDPTTVVWRTGVASVRALRGDVQGASAALRQGLGIDPAYFPLHDLASRLAFGAGDRAAAEAEARTVERLLGPRPSLAESANLAGLYTLIGLEADAQRLVAYVEAEAGQRPVSALTLAWLYLGVRDLDKGFEWLDTAIRTHDTYGYNLYFTFAHRSPFNTLWDDPRFQQARRDLGLADPP